MQNTDTSGQRVRVAVVGAGPSGFYAAEALLKQGAEVAIIERLPAPFGLVRYGVAPDHPKLKTTTLVFDRIARSEHCHFFGNVEVGRDISTEQLMGLFDAVILAHGASGDKQLGIPGEELPGCHGAAAFVGWYNGHPDFRDRQFDLSQRCAVILGNGNVALDVARVLAKSPAALAKTDIADHALQALMQSKVTDIHVVGRRGPLQAKFSTNELRELGELEGCAIHCEAADVAESTGTQDGAGAANIAWFRKHTAPLSPNAAKRIHFHFFSSPAFACGGDRLQSVAFSSGTVEEISAGLLFRAIGYRGVPVAGIPFDGNLGIVPTIEHRVTGPEGEAVPRLYATGWIKRGPSGIIGTNRADSVAVVRRVMEDLGAMPARASRGAAGLRDCLHQAGREFVDFTQWLRIDRAEVEAGAARSKPREKFTQVRDFLLVAQGN